MNDQSEQDAYMRLLRRFSRRGFLKRLGLLAATVTATTLGSFGLPALKAYADVACNVFFGACSPCFSFASGCSPNGGTCLSSSCTCEVWQAHVGNCIPPMVRAYVYVCDGGLIANGCTGC